jgi:hypothetical protein
MASDGKDQLRAIEDALEQCRAECMQIHIRYANLLDLQKSAITSLKDLDLSTSQAKREVKRQLEPKIKACQAEYVAALQDKQKFEEEWQRFQNVHGGE